MKETKSQVDRPREIRNPAEIDSSLNYAIMEQVLTTLVFDGKKKKTGWNKTPQSTLLHKGEDDKTLHPIPKS